MTPGAATSPDGPSLRDSFSGSARITGAYFRARDDGPAIIEDDGLLTTVIRGIANARPASWLSIEMNYFMDLGRAPYGEGGDGTFASAGTSSSTFRSPYLVYEAWSRGNVRGSIGADRLALRVRLGRTNLVVGRFPITYTTSTFITPNDFFAPFGATAVNRIYKPGVDAIRIERALTDLAQVEAVAVLGNDDAGVPSLAESAFIGTFSTVLAGLEWRVLAGKLARASIVGASVQGDLGPVHLHAEGHFGVANRALSETEQTQPAPLYGRLAFGPTYTFNWRNATLGAEYAYLSDGGARPEDYLEVRATQTKDALPYLGRHYVGGYAGVDIVPVINAAALSLINAQDGSGIVGVSLKYNAADEVDLLLGGFVPWGRAPTPRAPTMDPGALPFSLQSEFGGSPLTLYVESRVFF